MREPSKTFEIKGAIRSMDPGQDMGDVATEARIVPDTDLIVLPVLALEVVLTLNELRDLYDWADERIEWEDEQDA